MSRAGGRDQYRYFLLLQRHLSTPSSYACFHFLCAKQLKTMNHSREPTALGSAMTDRASFCTEKKNEVHFGISTHLLHSSLLEGILKKRFKIACKLKQDCMAIDSNVGRSDSEPSLSFLLPILIAKEGFQGVRCNQMTPEPQSPPCPGEFNISILARVSLPKCSLGFQFALLHSRIVWFFAPVP